MSMNNILQNQNTTTVHSIYVPPECQHSTDGKPIIILPTEGKEIVKVKAQHGTRKLFVPSRKPAVVPKFFTNNEFNRLKEQAHVVTFKDRMAMIEEAEKKKRNLENESHLRKEELSKHKQNQSLKPGAKLSNIETDAKKKTFYLLKRAFDLRQEQEDEVKKANQLILASKCLAIRAAQVKEKQLIKKELDDEEKRLDMMMEEQRRKALQNEEEKRKKDKEKNQVFVCAMKQQIKEKEIEKLQEGERVEEEAKMQNRALVQMQLDEEAKRVRKLAEQAKMREDLNQANEDISRYKQVEREEQRIAELRVQEFMRKKAEREAAHEEELRLQRIAKEKEIARLRALQERQADQQAAQDELNALRIQEEVEKEWRRKEKEMAERKARDEEQLKKSRQQQIEDIRKLQAVELEREKQDFYKVIQVQKELHEKELEKQRQKWIANQKHRKDILQQVNEKERTRINERKAKFEEADAIRAEAELRMKHIQDALKNKMTKLRVHQVPEKVVRDIERQLKLE